MRRVRMFGLAFALITPLVLGCNDDDGLVGASQHSDGESKARSLIGAHWGLVESYPPPVWHVRTNSLSTSACNASPCSGTLEYGDRWKSLHCRVTRAGTFLEAGLS